MAQPETMDELILSLRTQAAASGTKVIPTLATRDMSDLPQAHQVLAERAMRDHVLLSLTAKTGNALPLGMNVEVTAQTDQHFRELDRDHIYAGLVAHIITVAVRTR